MIILLWQNNIIGVALLLTHATVLRKSVHISWPSRGVPGI